MRLKNIILLLFAAIYINSLFAQNTTWSKEFADAIIDRYSNIDDLTGKGWEYSNSIVLIGIEKVYYETGDVKYLNYIKKYIDSFIDSNGNIFFDPTANNLDHLHPGWLCITLYQELGLDKYKKAAINIRAEFDNQPRNSEGGFWHKQKYENQMWADGIYMAEPFLIRYGSVFNELEYCANEATQQAILLADHTYDSTKNLIVHGWDETKLASWANPITGNSPEVWSRGMGWYCMALVDILDYLPNNHENYMRIIEILQGLAVGIKTYQDTETGLWYQVVDKGSVESNWIETSGSSMFVYALKKAIDKKYIDSLTFMPVVQKGWKGLQTKITVDIKNQPIINDFVFGMGIKDSYESYIAQSLVSTPNSKYPHGYCGILLAASVMEFPLPKYYSLSVAYNGIGKVSVSPQKNTYASGSKVTLTASTQNGWEFVKWSGCVESSDNPLLISMDSNIFVTAVFNQSVPVIENSSRKPIVLLSNLVDSQLQFTVNETDALVSYCIVNTIGKLMCKSQKPSDSFIQSINVSTYPKGIYYLILQIDTEKCEFKFVKL